MSGVSLFKLLDYSIRIATFEERQDNDADRLLQVSGLKIVYNPTITQGESRLVSVDVWNRTEHHWNPLDPLFLYSFVTSSYACTDFYPYPELTGGDGSFQIELESGGVINEILLHEATADYLNQLPEPYNTTLEGRISANPLANETLDLIQTADSCAVMEYFSSLQQFCLPCPDLSNVAFSKKWVEFSYQQGRDIQEYKRSFEERENSTADESGLMKLYGRLELANRGSFNVTIVPKLLPAFLEVHIEGESSEQLVKGHQYYLSANESIALNLEIDPSPLLDEIGTITAAVSAGITYHNDGITAQQARECDQFNLDLAFDALLAVVPPSNSNNLGSIRFFGLSLMFVTMASALGFAIFVFKCRETRVVKGMQPIFLQIICCGIFIVSSTILPLSFDDEILTTSQMDKMCMSIPWLLSPGCTIVFSILFSKLWRINRLFHGQRFQHLKLTEKDVLGPFLILFSVNLILLVTWSVTDPNHWARLPVEGEGKRDQFCLTRIFFN